MPITLNTLLEQRSLKLSLVVEGAAGAIDTPISWVHSSESADPTPYLEGGELLLLTGLLMPETEPDERFRRYVARLADIGIRGIGFGVGVHHADIPEWLVRQCEMSDMPLFSVPLEISFIAITKAISRGVADSKQQGFARLYRNQQQLMRSVHTLDPVSTIISRTAELIGGWAALLNPAGAVVESSHRFLPIEISALGDTLTFSTLGEAKFVAMRGYDIAVFHIVSPAGQTLGYLVAGYRGEKGTLDHPLVAQAAALLSLAISSSADANRALGRLRSAMVRQCLEGGAEMVRPYASDLWDGMPAEPLAVLRVTGEQEALEAAQRLFEPFRKSLAKNMNPAVFGMIEGDFWAVVSQSNAGEWMASLLRDSRVVIGQSSGCIWRDLPRARHEAYQAASEAMTSGEQSLRYGQSEGGGSLENMVEPSKMRAFADLKLAPISALEFNLSVGPHGENTRSSGRKTSADGSGAGMTLHAVDVLRTWLRCRGRAEEVARTLGLHRHTVTKYMARISKALSVDLADPQTVAELWYACRFTRFGGTASGRGGK
ncbi:PucR family transcriptional regulator [Bifidobacterium sp. SMB2]|uniref:PucR family transcriptional regulator n=1 Tax=Bifidobacterium saimiriisciurei TaxID=2661627 RepID=A0ABX0C9Q0_9BIFI|nr:MULTISPECIES: PucR family transcriptional regulator [Bifidobacterium]NEG96707.1 PucR family transcriptional regulator [Bifidobacterium sp. SMB2]NEH11863.1 PucR family transcriptional regulator [Bifidobacterium saimiriisciurei]